MDFRNFDRNVHLYRIFKKNEKFQILENFDLKNSLPIQNENVGENFENPPKISEIY